MTDCMALRVTKLTAHGGAAGIAVADRKARDLTKGGYRIRPWHYNRLTFSREPGLSWQYLPPKPSLFLALSKKPGLSRSPYA